MNETCYFKPGLNAEYSITANKCKGRVDTC